MQISRRFLKWIKGRSPGEFRNLPEYWIDKLHVRGNADHVDDHEYVALEDVFRLLALIISNDLALWRDPVAAAMLFLSSMRGGAFSTLPIAAVDLVKREIRQWPSLGVHTKNNKHATPYLLDIPELLAVVERWDTFVRTQLPPTAMWYTPIISRWGRQSLSVDKAGDNRNIELARRMRNLFALAGIPYKSPHKFRHGHTVFGLPHAKVMADYKAVSTNLMHADMSITDGVYARWANDDVRQRIAGLTSSTNYLSQIDGNLADFIGALSGEQKAKALIVIAQKLAK